MNKPNAPGEGSELPAMGTDLERTLTSGIGSCITITAADEAEGERVVAGWEEVNVKQFAKRWVARAGARQRLADEAIEVLRTLRGLEIDAEVKAIRRAQAAEYELAALKAALSSPQLTAEQLLSFLQEDPGPFTHADIRSCIDVINRGEQ